VYPITRLKPTITNSLRPLVISLSVLATVFVLNSTQTVQTDTTQIAKAAEQTAYLQLTDAPLHRDISAQMFLPLQ
jgi:hypothetical protein